MSKNTQQNEKISTLALDFVIQNFDVFANMLHDRLNAILAHIEDIEDQFMLITNLRDRAEKDRITQADRLLYSGTDEQRRILEIESPRYFHKKFNKPPTSHKWEVVKKNWYRKPFNEKDRKQWQKVRDEDWEDLKNRPLAEKDEQVETYEIFRKYKDGEVDISSIEVKLLSNYFEILSNPVQELEFPIMADYFDIENTSYVGIPLLGLGLFQGMVWIVFPTKIKSKFDQPTIKRIVKLFSSEYDGLMLAWDVVEKNADFESLVDLVSVDKIVSLDRNSLMGQVRMRNHYKRSNKYLTKLIKEGNNVAAKFKNAYRNTAVITTLLDSFAHNISAHSLITLKAWYRDLAEFKRTGKSRVLNNPLIKLFQKDNTADVYLEEYQLYRFLLEKGAFWSGIARKTNFSGERENAYQILWHEFINNALYLGTLADSEKINKIHLNITICKSEAAVKGSNFLNTKTIKVIDGTPLDGRMVTIDLNNPDTNRKYAKDERPYSIFVEKNKTLFDTFKTALSELSIFFPGGVIGKHALFTLIENEIRNVKHYPIEQLKQIQKEGLTVNLSFHERPFDSTNPKADGNHEIIKVGVWLKHPLQLSSSLLLRRIESLNADIISENFKPKLGGNHQDKICAAQLMTNDFSNVQKREDAIGTIYFPWIKSASSTVKRQDSDDTTIRDFEVSLRRYEQLINEGESTGREQFEKEYTSEEGNGYLKKYFHVWKGEDTLPIQQASDIEGENPARFKFVQLTQHKEQDKLHKKLKHEKNLVRVLPTSEHINSLEEAYTHWMKIWLPDSTKQQYAFHFQQNATPTNSLVLKDGKVHFLDDVAYQDYLDENTPPTKEDFDDRTKLIRVKHRGEETNDPNWFNYRSHGYLKRKFSDGKELIDLEQDDIDKVDVYELFEALATRICIFDRRIYNQVINRGNSIENSVKKLQLYRDHLNIDFRDEDPKVWGDLWEKGLMNYHFLVVHLSFLETFKDENAKGEPYGEQGMPKLIQEKIIGNIPPEKVPDNFVLVITTGRGRIEWWEAIKTTPYARFTTFRPIESISAAVNDALDIGDDIDLKINLAKILFGS